MGLDRTSARARRHAGIVAVAVAVLVGVLTAGLATGATAQPSPPTTADPTSSSTTTTSTATTTAPSSASTSSAPASSTSSTTSTTSTSTTASSTTTAPPQASASTTSADTTSTTAPVTHPTVPAPPAPEADLGAGFESEEDRDLYEALDGEGDARDGHYADQPVFDPLAANAVLEGELALARHRVVLASRAQDAARARLAGAEGELASADAGVDGVGAHRRDEVRAAADAEEARRRRLVAAYVRHGGGELGVLEGATAGQAALRAGLMESVARRDLEAVRTAREAVAGLDPVGQRAAERLARARAALDSARRDVAAADWERLAAESDVEVLAAGSHVAVAGFVFPVVGDVSFIDSFGAPRNVGTSYEHWHEGTDIMAAHGTPVVAVEDGVVRRAATNPLGGNAITMVGASGHLYYYAHLSAYAPGIESGSSVLAGQLIGFVGDTGDARGGAPHVHFEITPPGTDVEVNPYPLLAVAWAARVQALGAVGLEPGDPVPVGLTGVVSGAGIELAAADDATGPAVGAAGGSRPSP